MNFPLSFIDIIGSIIGLFYIVSEYRAGRWFWPWSLLMSLFYIIIDYSSGYYANGTTCPMRMVPYILVAVALLSVALWWLLGKVGESQYPWLDGISSALSIVGMWMLAQKWWQQWFCWMIVEPLMVVLFWMGGNYASAILYVIYEVFCVLGLISWRRRAMKEGLGEPEDSVRMSKL